ncbi:MAG: iron-sulfur cluster assembly protein [Pseudomonadota bacterium]
MSDETDPADKIKTEQEEFALPDVSGYSPYYSHGGWEGPQAEPVPEGTVSEAGQALATDDNTRATQEDVEDALRTVYDPEIPVNIYDLGLIYGCDMDGTGDIEIRMTLTAPACPVAGELPLQVAEAVADVPGVGVVRVVLTWEPAWNPAMMSEDARMALDFY